MITLDDLMPFCSKDETRGPITKPLCDGEWTYATDGRIIARVPGGLVEGAQIPLAANWGKLLASCREITQPPVDRALGHFWPFPQPSPEPAPDWRTCFFCEGKGCEECDMEGKENFAKPHYDALFRSVYNVAFLNRLWRLHLKLPGGFVCAAGEVNANSMGARTLLVRGTSVPVFFVLMPVRWTVEEAERLQARHYDQDPALLPGGAR